MDDEYLTVKDIIQMMLDSTSSLDELKQAYLTIGELKQQLKERESISSKLTYQLHIAERDMRTLKEQLSNHIKGD